MEREIFEDIIENLFLVIPLFKRKFMRYDMYKDNIGLSPSHFHIIFLLDDLGRMPVTEIARALNISKTNVTPLIQRLIEKELVERISDQQDRRYIHIDLSQKGREFIQNHKEIMVKDFNDKIQGFSDEELKNLAISLKNLKELIIKIN